MAALNPEIKLYADAIISIADKYIANNQPGTALPAIEANKLEELAQWQAYRAKALEFYAM